MYYLLQKFLNIKPDSLQLIAFAFLFMLAIVLFLIKYVALVNKDANEYYALLPVKSKRRLAMVILGTGAFVFMSPVVELCCFMVLSLTNGTFRSNSWLQGILILIIIILLLVWFVSDNFIYILHFKHFYHWAWSKLDEDFMWSSILLSLVMLLPSIGILSIFI